MTITSTSLVLVAVINNARDFEIARLLGWYRIPLRSAPKVIAVDYLAFYQTAAFAGEKWQIQYVAQVLGHELTTRADLLKDEPDHIHARQEYYKIQVGPLERLAYAIPSERWRRITFFYTTGEYLLKARVVEDLIVGSGERAFLWRSLRERAIQNDTANQAYLPDLDVDPQVLALLLGIKEDGSPYGEEPGE